MFAKYFFKFIIDFKIKADGSPLTKADSEANKIISSELTSFFPNIKIISEEGNHKNSFCKYFLVDPLDGTKEFIKGSEEYTVNIALMKKNKPILGIIYIPEKKEIFWNDNMMKMIIEEDDIDSYEHSCCGGGGHHCCETFVLKCDSKM